MHTHDLTLGLAFGLGALHALEPGHGKTAMLVYFAGERKSLLHPLVVGVSSAVSHSVSLIAIAAIVHLTHHMMTGDHHHENETVTRAMQWISAVLVLVVGLWMMWSAWRTPQSTGCGCSSHSHHPKDDSTNAVDADQKTGASYSMSALLGIAFGLLPCPSAMAAYFTSMSDGAPVMAYSVIGLFAAGIALSLTVIGILVQTCGIRFSKRDWKIARRPWAHIRAGLIMCVGVIYLIRTAIS